jgi:hypothetical protein
VPALFWRILAVREYSRMLLTHNEGRLSTLGSLRWDRGRGRSDVLDDDAPSVGWVESKLTENGTLIRAPKRL